MTAVQTLVQHAHLQTIGEHTGQATLHITSQPVHQDYSDLPVIAQAHEQKALKSEVWFAVIVRLSVPRTAHTHPAWTTSARLSLFSIFKPLSLLPCCLAHSTASQLCCQPLCFSSGRHLRASSAAAQLRQRSQHIYSLRWTSGTWCSEPLRGAHARAAESATASSSAQLEQHQVSENAPTYISLSYNSCRTLSSLIIRYEESGWLE